MVFGFWECFPKFSLPLGKHHGACGVRMHNFWSPKELMYLQGNYHRTHKFSDSECAVLALGFFFFFFFKINYCASRGAEPHVALHDGEYRECGLKLVSYELRTSPQQDADVAVL